MENLRRPVIQIRHPTEEEPTGNEMTHHLKVKNEQPTKWWCQWFNRDSAIDCIARLQFLDQQTNNELCHQIEAKWTKWPESRKINIGFIEEDLDLLIRAKGINEFFVYDNCQKKRLQLRSTNCIIRVEIEAINLGILKREDFILKIIGKGLNDIEIIRNS